MFLALAYLAARRLGERSCRFDVVAGAMDEASRVVDVRHLRHAFDLDGWAS